MKLPISERARKYGYVFWSKAMDRDFYALFGEVKKVDVWFKGRLLGEKKIDWKNRRLYIGYPITRNLPANVTNFELKLDKKGALKIKCQ